MKNLLQILFFFFFVSQFCFAQPVSPSASQGGWFWQNPQPQGNNLLDVKFITENTAIAVGAFGTILKTTDAGINWIKLFSGTNNDLYSIAIRDLNNWVIVGDLVMLTTTDSGENWILQNLYPYTLNSVCFTDFNTAIAVGFDMMSYDSTAVIMKTTNGGTDWSVRHLSTPWDLHSVCFKDNNFGYAVGYTNYPLRGII